MPSTYTPIATYTFANSTTRLVTLSSIPSTYTDLRVVVNGGYTFTDCQWGMQFNTDTSNNYSTTGMYGSGTAAGSFRTTSQSSIAGGWYPYPNDSTNPGISTVDILSYSNTTTYKTSLIRSSNTIGTVVGTSAIVGLWRSTAAISSITFDLGTYNSPYWTAGSTITLYGIKAA